MKVVRQVSRKLSKDVARGKQVANLWTSSQEARLHGETGDGMVRHAKRSVAHSTVCTGATGDGSTRPVELQVGAEQNSHCTCCLKRGKAMQT